MSIFGKDHHFKFCINNVLMAKEWLKVNMMYDQFKPARDITLRIMIYSLCQMSAGLCLCFNLSLITK